MDSKDPKSSIFQKINKIGSSIGQITPLDLYKLAADSIINQSARSHVVSFLSKHQNNLEMVAWPAIIGPLTVATLYYGYLRSTLTQDDFIFYTLSLLAALKKLHLIQFVSHIPTRGLVLKTFVDSITQGKKPHVAINLTFANINIHEVVKFINPYKKSNKNFYTKRNGNSKQSFNNWKNNNNSSKPTKINCRFCKALIPNNRDGITRHNEHECTSNPWKFPGRRN